MEQAPVHGSEPNLTPEREGCPTYRDSQVLEEVDSCLPFLSLAMTGLLAPSLNDTLNQSCAHQNSICSRRESIPSLLRTRLRSRFPAASVRDLREPSTWSRRKLKASWQPLGQGAVAQAGQEPPAGSLKAGVSLETCSPAVTEFMACIAHVFSILEQELQGLRPLCSGTVIVLWNPNGRAKKKS